MDPQIAELQAKLKTLVESFNRPVGKTINRDADAKTYQEIITTVKKLQALGVNGGRTRRTRRKRGTRRHLTKSRQSRSS